jgi:hypothetical protein
MLNVLFLRGGVIMSASFPPNLLYFKRYDDREENAFLIENESKVVKLPDGRKLHVLLENPATKKAPVSFDELERRNMLWAALSFILLAICLICLFFNSI